MFACLKHPKHGYILYDTGYSQRFFSETASFPFSLYAKITPVFLNNDDCALEKLAKISIKPEQIRYVIISHFHADHIAAIKDFPEAKFIYMPSAYNKVKNTKAFKALLNGFLKGLLPDDFEQRSVDLFGHKTTLPGGDFEAYDLFNDGSLLAVHLPGHAQGQIGLYLTVDDKKIFLVADSCWMSEAYEKNIGPNPITYLITHDKKAYKDTLSQLHKFSVENPDVTIIPSHCGEKFLEYVELSLISPDKLNGL
jgi:glyoxylase-like metal-dependent hydrolase (beta-lactamase superfamily II)